MTTRVILVRHGQSTYNVEHRIQGRLDESVLTEKGQSDAARTGEVLANIQFGAMYCSPLQRARETAEIIRSHLKTQPNLQPTELLLEVDLPLWENLQRQAVIEQFPQDYQRWQEQPDEFFMTISENGQERQHFPVLSLFEQAKQFWLDLLARHKDETVLVVAHNGINRCLIATALGIQPKFYQGIQQSNCGISILNIADVASGEFPPPAAVQLESMNLTQHLSSDLPSFRSNHQGPRLLLIRHGETEWNRKGQFQGQIDVPLNDNGRQQGRKAGEFLKSFQIDAGFSSPMARPRETAEIILEHHPGIKLQFDDDFKEISHGLWEGKLEDEINQSYPGLLQQWKTTPEVVQMPEGENLQQVWERVKVAWRKMVQSIDQQPIVAIVVAHDAVNKAALCQLFDLDPEHFWNFKQGNGAVTVIDYPKGVEGRPVLQAMNITTHLSDSVLDQTAAGAL
ncbi:MAG: histidine phosphatase family protein [Microcoleaceae cyanobacterium]